MIPVIVVLLIIPVIGLILFLLKSILKLSFSVLKILAVLLVLWLIYGFVTGHTADPAQHRKAKPQRARGRHRAVFGVFTQGELDVAPIFGTSRAMRR
ncbi:MAG: hypothetical protein ACLUO4_09430 [Christensenellales bacterium]